MAEQVFQEHATGGAPQTPSSPAGACFAGVSRLAFDVAAGDQIELTVAGILDAMARLPMAIVPLAAPRRIWYAWLEPGRIAAAPLGELAAPFESAGATGTALMVERVRATRILTATGLGVAVRSLEPEVRRAVLTLPIEDRAAALAEISRVSEFQRAAFARLVRNPDPRPAFADETAIEVPSRLQLSPSVEGGWAHAVHVDEERGDGTGPVELWHTRLGVRKPRDDGTMEVDETDPVQRIVRGVWTRDLSTWGGPLPSPDIPFRMSTAPQDRRDIVGLSTGAGMPTWASPWGAQTRSPRKAADSTAPLRSPRYGADDAETPEVDRRRAPPFRLARVARGYGVKERPFANPRISRKIVFLHPTRPAKGKRRRPAIQAFRPSHIS